MDNNIAIRTAYGVNGWSQEHYSFDNFYLYHEEKEWSNVYRLMYSYGENVKFVIHVSEAQTGTLYVVNEPVGKSYDLIMFDGRWIVCE